LFIRPKNGGRKAETLHYVTPAKFKAGGDEYLPTGYSGGGGAARLILMPAFLHVNKIKKMISYFFATPMQVHIHPTTDGHGQ